MPPLSTSRTPEQWRQIRSRSSVTFWIGVTGSLLGLTLMLASPNVRATPICYPGPCTPSLVATIRHNTGHANTGYGIGAEIAVMAMLVVLCGAIPAIVAGNALNRLTVEEGEQQDSVVIDEATLQSMKPVGAGKATQFVDDDGGFCTKCGMETKAGAEFCNRCGAKL